MRQRDYVALALVAAVVLLTLVALGTRDHEEPAAPDGCRYGDDCPGGGR